MTALYLISLSFDIANDHILKPNINSFNFKIFKKRIYIYCCEQGIDSYMWLKIVYVQQWYFNRRQKLYHHWRYVVKEKFDCKLVVLCNMSWIRSTFLWRKLHECLCLPLYVTKLCFNSLLVMRAWVAQSNLGRPTPITRFNSVRVIRTHVWLKYILKFYFTASIFQKSPETVSLLINCHKLTMRIILNR